jgi:hypothetical protein
MGVDYGGKGAITAIGDATIIGDGGNGWPPKGRAHYLLYKLSKGPLVGRYVYVAEGILPTFTSGRVRAGQTIARFTADAAPFTNSTGIETGWSSPTVNLTYFSSHCGHYGERGWTAPGNAFARLLRRLGAPTRDNPGPGPMFTNSCAQA